MKHFNSLSEMHRTNGFEAPESPMLSLIRCAGNCTVTETEFTTEFYMIAFKKMKSGVIVYGRTEYDSESGSMYFIKPNQIVEMKDVQFEEDGFALFFHPDFLNGHSVHNEIQKYSYFDYETSEALHLSPREEQIIWELYGKIETEYYNNQDEYSRAIIIGHIDSILKYSQRFYKRQFINRTELSGKTVSKFNDTLRRYFENGGFQQQGLPTVKSMADQLHLSPRYLSDLLKQETGKTGMELIHIFLIAEAKHLLMRTDTTVAEIGYTLGFENMPYFSRLFKREVGVSPNQYKKQNLV